MELTYAEVCVAGPVRPNNEDRIGFWLPDDAEKRREMGAIAIVADGVGGHSRGEVASQMAVKHFLDAFQASNPELDPRKILREAFDSASRAIFDDSMKHPDQGKMCTTLTAAIFRHNEVTLGYVGDSRAYLVRPDSITQLTTDHSALGFQVKYGLVHERHAMTSPLRSQLTRSLGTDPICRFDVVNQELSKGDFIVQCTDGLYSCATDSEIWDIVNHFEPEEAARRLLRLAEKRHGEDNISLQIIRIDQVHRAIFFRGVKMGYHNSVTVDNNSKEEFGEGFVLDNRFEFIECVSRSGMASIYRALDLTNHQIVAIKVPHRHLESDVASFSRFEREEQIGKSLNHPLILKFIPVENKSRPYIVMEFLEGRTLAELMKDVRPTPEPEAVKIASRICEALEYLHRQNVVHRDLKPQNIMLCNDGSLRIMDFGIAKSSQARRLTFVGFTPAMGTPDYMAPEQVQGKRGDERTDIYSLGAMLYEMATGASLFEGENPYVVMNSRLTGDPVAPRRVNPKLTPVIEEIILHALERSPAYRYSSAAEMKAELDDYEKVSLTERWKRLQPPQIWKTKYRMIPIIAGIVVLQILLFLGLWWVIRHTGRGH